MRFLLGDGECIQCPRSGFTVRNREIVKKSSHFQSCSVGALLIGNYHKPATFAGISAAEMCLLPPPHNVTFKTAAHDGRITGSLSSHGS